MYLSKAILILLLLLFVTCKTEHNKTVWIHVYDDLDKLSGDIKQVTVTSDEHAFKDFHYIINIDREGKERELNMYFHEIQAKTRYISKYYKNENTESFIGYTKSLSTSKEYQALGKETMTEICKYDNEGRIIKLINIGGMDDGDSCIYRYNSFGNLIECDQYNSNGQLDSKKKFKYDNRNLMTESLEEFEKDSLEEKVSYQYKAFDLKNNWLSRISKSDDGSSTTLTRKITYY